MFKTFSLSFLFALVFLSSSPASAEADVVCRYGTPEAWDQISLMYAGPWQIAHHAGNYMAGPMTMPFPQSGDLETMEIKILPA